MLLSRKKSKFKRVFQLGIIFFILCCPKVSFAETAKLTVREIKIRVGDIFDGSDLGFLYQAANKLKINTREDLIHRELLFKEGDVYNEFLVQESERNLRSLSFLKDVRIVAIPDGSFVDLVVNVRDTWTIFPQIGIKTGGGSNKKSIGLSEGNILGFGKRVELLYAEDDNREKIEGVWEDIRVNGTDQRMLLGSFKRSDGFRFIGSYGVPFRSLAEPHAWNIATDFSDTVGKLFSAGDERFIFRSKHQEFVPSYTKSFGDPQSLVNRYTIGYLYSKDTFSEADEDDFSDVDVDPNSVSRDPSLLAKDRKFSGLSFGVQQIEPDFISLSYIDRFERVDDFNLGKVLNTQFTFASDLLGSAEDTALWAFTAADGKRLSSNSFIRGGIGASSRYNFSGFANTLAHAEVKYYKVLGTKYLLDFYVGKHTLASSLAIDFSDKLDRDKEFLLGGNNGLRGYQYRTFTGTSRGVFNVEDRFHLFEDIFRLVNLGGAFFFDAGGTSVQGLGDIVTDELRADVGFGIRIAFPRSSGGAVLSLDLALPLRDGPDGSNAFEPRLLISTGQAFSAKLASESGSTRVSEVSVGKDE